MNHLSRMLLVILLLAPAGCKKEPPPMAAMSPVANPPPAASDPDDPATDPDPPASPRTNDKNDWRRQKPGTGSGSAAATTEPAKAPPAAKPNKEDPAAKAERLAKLATQRAADAALRMANNAMKDCYDRAKAPSASATISFSVRSTGYVSAPRVKGVESSVAACIENVLRDLRVKGVQSAGLVVERTLRFTRR